METVNSRSSVVNDECFGLHISPRRRRKVGLGRSISIAQFLFQFIQTLTGS